MFYVEPGTSIHHETLGKIRVMRVLPSGAAEMMDSQARRWLFSADDFALLIKDLLAEDDEGGMLYVEA